MKVYASIHFAEDLTFETLAQLLADWQDEDLTFENIRVNTYLSGGDLFLIRLAGRRKPDGLQ